MSVGVADRLGLATAAAADVYSGVALYRRVWLQHDFHDAHYVEMGAYGMQASRSPGGRER